MVAENEPPGGGGLVRQYSQGLYVAAICNDYPQLWDIEAPIADRPAQYAASVAYLRATDPNAFFPFTIADWTHSPWTEFRACIKWPAPSNFVFPVPQPAHYPDVPTLVLSGDLDSLTSPEGARLVASRFPNSTFVSIANGVHVMAISDFGRCASNIVVHFVATESAGDTSCAAKYNEVRDGRGVPAAARRCRRRRRRARRCTRRCSTGGWPRSCRTRSATCSRVGSPTTTAPASGSAAGRFSYTGDAHHRVHA